MGVVMTTKYETHWIAHFGTQARGMLQQIHQLPNSPRRQKINDLLLEILIALEGFETDQATGANLNLPLFSDEPLVTEKEPSHV